jgi:hypothetical protein
MDRERLIITIDPAFADESVTVSISLSSQEGGIHDASYAVDSLVINDHR